MKAALLKTWNELELADLPEPHPGQNEALIKVRCGGVCGSDITVYRGLHPTAVAPVVLCHEILGNIETLPEGYNGSLKIGDRVLMNPVIACEECAACKNGHENVCGSLKLLGIHVNGGFAEYTAVRVDSLVAVEPSIPDHIAVLGEPFAVAYHVTKRGGVAKGDKVLIIGAGTIGIVTALAAIGRGADVWVSELNTERIALANKLGINTINPAECEIFEQTKALTGGLGFDIVIDASGSKAGALLLPELCRIAGRIMSLGLSGAPCEFPLGKVSFKELTLIGSRLYSQEDFEAGVRMMEQMSRERDLSGVVSDVMPLAHVIEAIELMKSGKNKGKILIDCR